MALPLELEEPGDQATGEALSRQLGGSLLGAFRRMRSQPLEAWPDIIPRVDLAGLAPWIRFEQERYTRVLLASDGWAEALLMGWLPGQNSVIHDHGDSHGFARVVAGDAVEHRYQTTPSGRVRITQTRRIGVDDVLFERAGDVHSIRNDSAGLLLTLHVYAPPLANFSTYELDE